MSETNRYIDLISEQDYNEKKFTAGLQGVTLPDYEFDNDKPRPKNREGRELTLPEMNASINALNRSRALRDKARVKRKKS